MHESNHRGAHECLRVTELERDESRRASLSFGLNLFGVLEVKDGLDRTGKENRLKNTRIAFTGMCHRMHFLDLQFFYVFWTTGLWTVLNACMLKGGGGVIAEF